MRKIKLKPQHILFLIAALYFLVFIIPNLTGAKDVNMLSAFEHDEFAQYPNVIHMLARGDTLYQSIRNFVVYLHYYYGYPFYFFSALAILPVKWIMGTGWENQTQVLVAVLRQMINVLPMILAALFLVKMQSRERPEWKAIPLFIILLTIPAVIANNLWWHPDSLLTLFCVLTLFFLIKDDLRFGSYFYLSGVMCALAIGAKILGVLFVLTYLTYLIAGLASRKAKLPKVIGSAVLFLIVLFVSIVISNPLLLLPIERGEIIAVFKANLIQSSQGFWIAGNSGASNLTMIWQMMTQNYGAWVLLPIGLISTIAGLFNPKTRLKNLLILTWVVGYLGYFLVFAATLRPHYFIPALLPLYSTFFDLIPNSWTTQSVVSQKSSFFSRLKMPFVALLLTAVAIQSGFNIFQDVGTVKGALVKEEKSTSIGLYRQFETLPNAKKWTNLPLTVYRDWRAYVPDNLKWNIQINWELANYDYIAEINPDLMFIEYDNALYFSDTQKLGVALNPELFARMNTFYSDVIHAKVKGYILLLKTDFGYVFAKEKDPNLLIQ